MKNKYTFILSLFTLLFSLPTIVLGQCDFEVDNTITTEATCGQSDGFVELTLSGGIAPYTLDWSGGTVMGNVITGMAAGVYDITITDGTPCSEVIQVTIQASSSPTIDQIIPTNATCGNTDGEIEVFISGGTPDYEVSIGGLVTLGNNPITVTGLSAGSYVVSVIDDNGCTAEGFISIEESSGPIIDDITVTNASCNDNGSVEVTVTGGTPPYQFNLGGTVQTSGFFTNLPVGTYTIEVSDANGCVSIVTFIILEGLNISLPFIQNPCGQADGVISVSADGGVPPYAYNLNGIIQNNGTFENLAAGVYELVITDADNCVFEQTFNLQSGPALLCVADAPNGYQINCVFPMIELGVACDIPLSSFTYAWSNGFNGVAQSINVPGNYDVTVTDAEGCTNVIDYIVTEDLDLQCGTIQGQVTVDDNDNCSFDNGEVPFAGYLVQAVGDQTFFGFTDANGQYTINTVEGDYEVSVVGYDPVLWLPCIAIENVTVTPDDIAMADFSIEKLIDCPLMEVQIATPLIRRCFDGYYAVNYCNNGTVAATDASIIVTFPSFISIINAPPYTDNGDDTYTFEIGDVNFGECGNFIIEINTSCDAFLGQTLCTSAEIFPQDPCSPNDPNWSGASLEITATCDGDEIQYVVTNVGTGNMVTPTEYIVIEDGVMFMTAPDPFQLDAGQFMEINFPANGATYILQVNQVEGHPGNSNPILAVEGCGIGLMDEFTVGFTNEFAFDDADDFIDIDCHEVIGAWDPNDKQAFPQGYGEEHYITDTTDIDYLIRFQNTGTDTAFNIIVEDVLSPHLDITTLRPGVSSHPYTVDFLGTDTLHFVFDNIMLPDSNINEPLSHGFVQFSIKPRLGLPLETVVENYVDIFFDFNEAVRTNTVFHTVGEDFIIISSDHETFIPDLAIEVVPNPFSDQTRLTLKGIEAQNATLHLYDLQGQKIATQAFEHSSILIKRNGLLSGMYFYKIEMEGQLAGTGKLIIN